MKAFGYLKNKPKKKKSFSCTQINSIYVQIVFFFVLTEIIFVQFLHNKQSLKVFHSYILTSYMLYLSAEDGLNFFPTK